MEYEGLHVVFFYCGCYGHTIQSGLEKITKLQATIAVYEETGQSSRTVSEAEATVEARGVEAARAVRQLYVSPMIMENGID